MEGGGYFLGIVFCVTYGLCWDRGAEDFRVKAILRSVDYAKHTEHWRSAVIAQGKLQQPTLHMLGQLHFEIFLLRNDCVQAPKRWVHVSDTSV